MKEILNQEGNSNTFDLKILKNSGKVYLMDNHMAAAWCWTQKIDFTKSYNLFHIDKHYDLLNGNLECCVKSIKNQKFNFKESTIEEYINLKYSIPGIQREYQVFRFDNYMTILKELYPTIFRALKFATHKDGTIPTNWDFYEPEIIDLPTSNIDYWINKEDSNWIINIDIDYFFTKNSNDEYFQFLTDEYILGFTRQLKKVWTKIEVLTIALSPSFCGGMENSSRIADLIIKELNIN